MTSNNFFLQNSSVYTNIAFLSNLILSYSFHRLWINGKWMKLLLYSTLNSLGFFFFLIENTYLQPQRESSCQKRRLCLIIVSNLSLTGRWMPLLSSCAACLHSVKFICLCRLCDLQHVHSLLAAFGITYGLYRIRSNTQPVDDLCTQTKVALPEFCM